MDASRTAICVSDVAVSDATEEGVAGLVDGREAGAWEAVEGKTALGWTCGNGS